MAAKRPAGTRAPAKWIDESYQASPPPSSPPRPAVDLIRQPGVADPASSLSSSPLCSSARMSS
jgi:hypothetical protein